MINELQLGISVIRTKNKERISGKNNSLSFKGSSRNKTPFKVNVSNIIIPFYISLCLLVLFIRKSESPDFQETQHTETKDRLHKGVPSRTTEAMTDQLSHFPADRW